MALSIIEARRRAKRRRGADKPKAMPPAERLADAAFCLRVLEAAPSLGAADRRRILVSMAEALGCAYCEITSGRAADGNYDELCHAWRTHDAVVHAAELEAKRRERAGSVVVDLVAYREARS